jgi:hypothetical protein
MTQPKALVLDEIVRIYKNSANRVIGIHCIAVHEQREVFPNPIPSKINASRFKRTATIHVHFDRLNLVMGESRVISAIQMLGKYDDFTYNGTNTDIIIVKYLGNDQTNDLEVSLKNLPTIGETL